MGPRGLAWPLCFCCQEDEKSRKGGRQTTAQSADHHERHTKMRPFKGYLLSSHPQQQACLTWRPQSANQKDREKDRAGPKSSVPLSFEAMWVAAGRNRGLSFRDKATGPKQRQAGERPRLRGLGTPNSNPSYLYGLCSTRKCIPLHETKFFIY